MTESEKELLISKFNTQWEQTKMCIEQLKNVRSKEEYAMVFDINGFGQDDLIPEVFKNLRNKIT